ncbi:hypothetical protein [Streptomyces sp. NBC_01565]|uniref:hypothetical protein n=1 Tax=unclassified Streptomyces TaxID=2593676 RepID=UPI0022535359|nr:hypothetical protein [Streptomyces sp. NBC_01565]MCX4545723.1 hypothetical protein [Streptomyces sp. NBC_01565]
MVRRIALALTTTASLALAVVAAPHTAASPVPGGPEAGEAAAALAATYRATARFQRHEEAVEAGYVPDKYCVANKSGPGALGYPHFNHELDNSVDPSRPTALFYEDDGRGGKRLVGVQWLVYDRDQNLATSDDRPTMFGKPFKGPNPGNFPGQPIHYALHLWLWKKNPKGEFETYNPAVTCLPGTVRPKPPA